MLRYEDGAAGPLAAGYLRYAASPAANPTVLDIAKVEFESISSAAVCPSTRLEPR